MANYTSTSGSYTTTLTVTQTSQNTANNTSTLTYSLTLTKNAGSGLWNNNNCPYSVTIDGTQVASGTFTYDFRNYSSLTLKSSTTTTVNHNSDGTKTVSVSASVNMNNSDYVSVMQPSGSLTLTTIPRASDVTVSNYSITNTSGSISATITSKANFYHKWRYKIGSGSWSAWTNKGQINNTSSTVTVANTTLLAGMPTSTSTTFYIEVQTYSDSGYATLVGTKSASSTISVNTSNIKPSISLGNIAINSSPISGYAVAGYSSVKSTATTTNSSGASSVTNYFTVSHGSLVSSSSTTTSTTVTTNTLPANASNYTLTIYAYAKDSRGAVSSTVSKTITVYGYQPPTATLNAYRVASSTATAEDGAGTYAYVTFSGAVSSSVNSQNTIQSTTCTYSGSISGTATSGGHYALADTQTVTFTLTVADKVTSSTVQKTINTASFPLDLYDNGSGTVGVGLGTIAYGGTVTVPLDIRSTTGMVRYHISDVTHAEVVAQDSSLTSSSSDSDWFKALLKAICVKYPDSQMVRFIGRIDPNSQRNYEVTIYNTADTTNGLPRYSYGLYHSYGGSFRCYGTNDYTYYFWDGVYKANTADTATSATSTTKVEVTTTNPSAWTTYYVPFVNGQDSTRQVLANNGISYVTREGTTSVEGTAQLYLGNTTVQGTAGNKTGGLVVYSSAGKYSYVRSGATGTNKSNFFPNQDGTLRAYNTIWTGTKMAGESSGISLDVSGYSKLRIFFNSYSTNGVFELDLSHATAVATTSGWSYHSVGLTWAYATEPETHFCDCRVNDGKTSVYPERMGYWRIHSGSYDLQLRNGNSNYYVYRIDGVNG